MTNRTITNPVTGERATFIETSSESGRARTVIDMEVASRGGVPGHSHDDHDERIDVLEGVVEVTLDGVRHRLGAGEHVVIPRGKVHSWRNPSSDHAMKFRGMMTPGHAGFETAIRVLFGLARDGEVRASGVPRRLGDVGLFVEWNQGLPSGPIRLLAPLLAWAARRARARGRAGDLLRRYDAEEPART